jgi:hypothetical protein
MMHVKDQVKNTNVRDHVNEETIENEHIWSLRVTVVYLNVNLNFEFLLLSCYISHVILM